MAAGVRGLPESHGVVALAHDLVAGPVQELGQPADAAHKEAGVDVEQNDGWVAVGVLPVGEKRGLNRRDIFEVRGRLKNRSTEEGQTITVVSHQGEEGAEEGDGAEVSDVGVHVIVLLLGEQRVVALDPAALHVLVPTRLDVRLHQGSFTLA